MTAEEQAQAEQNLIAVKFFKDIAEILKSPLPMNFAGVGITLGNVRTFIPNSEIEEKDEKGKIKTATKPVVYYSETDYIVLNEEQKTEFLKYWNRYCRVTYEIFNFLGFVFPTPAPAALPAAQPATSDQIPGE